MSNPYIFKAYKSFSKTIFIYYIYPKHNYIASSQIIELKTNVFFNIIVIYIVFPFNTHDEFQRANKKGFEFLPSMIHKKNHVVRYMETWQNHGTSKWLKSRSR